MITFISVTGKTTLSDDVKSMTFEELKSTFEGKLDYVSLANQLGIKQTKIPKVKQEKSVEKPEEKTE